MRGVLELAGFAFLPTEGLDDPMSGDSLHAEVGHVLQCFLASAGGAAHALAEAHQRIDHERRPRQAHERQSGVVIEEQGGEPEQRERLASHIPDGFRTPLAAPGRHRS